MCSKYECIRCGYSTDLKQSMNLHLYKKKKPCQTIVNNIELTDEIKEYILNNRVYKIPEPDEVTSDEVKKTIEMKIEELYNSELFSDKDRMYMQLMILLRVTMNYIKDAAFDTYEMYLIHYIDNESFDQKLKDYYKFIGTLGLMPIVKNKSDNFIQYYRFYRDKEHLDLPEKTFNLSEKYMNLYTAEKSKIIHTEKELLTKKVMEIIFIKKDIENYEEIGKLFNMDEEFIRINA